MQSELKPCAHCGSSDIEDRESVSDYYVACCNCGARTGLVYLGASDAANAFKKREAIAAWNKRASDAEITRLRKIVSAFNNGMPPMTTKDAAAMLKERQSHEG